MNADAHAPAINQAHAAALDTTIMLVCARQLQDKSVLGTVYIYTHSFRYIYYYVRVPSPARLIGWLTHATINRIWLMKLIKICK